MRLKLVTLFMSALGVVSIAIAHGLHISPIPEFSLFNTTNGLESNFEYHFVASFESNTIRAATSEFSFVKSPVAMCVLRPDAFSTLEALTDSHWITTNISDTCDLLFPRKFGPFSSAKVRFFNPPNPYLNHHFNSYGQIESIVSTAIVQRMSFDAGVVQLENAMRTFVEKMGETRIFKKSTKVGKVSFSTRSPTSSGWYIVFYVKDFGNNRCFFCMTLFRKRNGESHVMTPHLVDVDI